MHFPLAPSHDSKIRDQRARRLAHARRDSARLRDAVQRDPASGREKGVALVLAITAIAILAVVLADMHEASTAAFMVATTERDQLRAEYMARSGINLTRLLVAQEPAIRVAVAPMYQMLTGRPPPMIPVWGFADGILRPFCDYDRNAEEGSGGLNFGIAEGLGDTGGTCEIVSFGENSRININQPLSFSGNRAQTVVAMQTFGLIGGYLSPSPYDPLFEAADPDGNFTSRLDLVSALIDWWDLDTDRASFDPGAGTVTAGGAEDDTYQTLDDPYRARNAPFDSIEELRLVRGVGDDFWATFVEPDPDDPRSRTVTIYGSGAVNPNEAPPEVLRARVCSIIGLQGFCQDPNQAIAFNTLLSTIRSIAPIPWFTHPRQFVEFLEGAGGERDLYPMLRGFLGADNPILFTPVTLTPEQRNELDGVLVTAARIITIQATGRAGRATVRIRTVMNFHDRWTPPPPNAGTMPGLGIFYYYRID